MRFRSIRPLLPLISALTLTTAVADFQLGLGGGVFAGTEYDEDIGYGLEAEVGFLAQDLPVNLFFGVRASYVDGLSSGASTFLEDSTDLDLFEGVAVARLLVPLGTDVIKLYGEGSIGTANLKVSGKTKVNGEIGGQDFSINSRFDSNDWVLAWGLGAGVQFDFTRNIGLRVGYNFHSFGDSDVFGLKLDTGSVNGVTSSLIFKF
jgi:opacity protein-like surface antigen